MTLGILTIIINLMTITLLAQHDPKLNAEILESTTTINRTSLDKYSKTVVLKTIIYNQKGADALKVVLIDDKHSKLEFANGKIYTNALNTAQDVKASNFENIKSNPEFIFLSDYHFQVYTPSHSHYPYHFDIEYKVNYNDFLSFDNWQPVNDINVSLYEARLIYHSSDLRDVNYKSFHDSISFKASNQELSWTLHNIKPISALTNNERKQPSFPTLWISPKKVHYEKTTGHFDSWETYGKWVNELIDERDELSEKTKTKLIKLTANCQSDLEKTQIIYKYMQATTRYVCIVKGIGGFQPIKAKEVDETKFGDCKALSNYTKALLNAVGIKSYYAEIGSGEHHEILFQNFASVNQTNHAILFVPLKNDTLWLECTNSNYPTGYIGSHNVNRFALVVTPNGGQLIKTKNYNNEENIQTSHLKLELENDGLNKAELNAQLSGSYFEKFSEVTSYSNNDKNEILSKHLLSNDLNEFNILQFNKLNERPFLQLNAELNINQKLQKTPNEVILNIPFAFKLEAVKKISNKSIGSYFIEAKQTQIDSVSIKKMPILKASNLPKSNDVKNKFGTFQLSVNELDDKFLIIRKISCNEIEIPQNELSAYNEFVEQITNSDEYLIFTKQ